MAALILKVFLANAAPGGAAAVAAAAEFAPRDAIEARLGGLLVALSEAAAFELALGGWLTSPRGRADALGLADRLAGRAVQAAEALARHQRPAEQRIVVERMVVTAGGQAPVRMVERLCPVSTGGSQELFGKLSWLS
jgi:hypothetical protein